MTGWLTLSSQYIPPPNHYEAANRVIRFIFELPFSHSKTANIAPSKIRVMFGAGRRRFSFRGEKLHGRRLLGYFLQNNGWFKLSLCHMCPNCEDIFDVVVQNWSNETSILLRFCVSKLTNKIKSYNQRQNK